MSQQPYGPGQPGQPGQPGGYQQPGQPQGYPQGGYPQPGQPQGYPQGGYQSGPPAQQSSGFGGSSNPLNSASTLAPILQIVAYVVIGLGVLAGILAFTLDGFGGTYKFQQFLLDVLYGLGFGGVLLALSAMLKGRSSS